jgi:hypothetical protein
VAGDLFAGIAVSSYAAALPWYTTLFGTAPSFFPHDTEAVWEVAEHRYVYIVEKPERAGSALVMLFVDDLDATVERLHRGGIEPTATETHGGGVRKVTFGDADGSEIAFGGAPPADG